MRESDLAFVVNSWLKSHQAVQTRAQGKAFLAAHAPLVRYLARDASVRLVACSTDDDDLIQAWVVADMRGDGVPVLHYIYTKDVFRKLGLGSRLARLAIGGADRAAFTHKAQKRADLPGVRLFFDPHAVITREIHDNQATAAHTQERAQGPADAFDPALDFRPDA